MPPSSRHVGDNVGDCAGMAAESSSRRVTIVAAIISAATLFDPVPEINATKPVGRVK